MISWGWGGGGGGLDLFFDSHFRGICHPKPKKKMLMPDGMDKVLPRRVSRPLWRTMPAWMPTFQCLSKILLRGGGGGGGGGTGAAGIDRCIKHRK